MNGRSGTLGCTWGLVDLNPLTAFLSRRAHVSTAGAVEQDTGGFCLWDLLAWAREECGEAAPSDAQVCGLKACLAHGWETGP